jgi:hypothetical protein
VYSKGPPATAETQKVLRNLRPAKREAESLVFHFSYLWILFNRVILDQLVTKVVDYGRNGVDTTKTLIQA